MRRASDERRSVFGLGRTNDGDYGGRLQSDRLPRRHGLAARQLDHRMGFEALRLSRGGRAHFPGNAGSCPDYGNHLPEAFAGYEREETKFPVEYPTACMPQAWVAGTPLLLLRTMLGIESDGNRLLTDPAVPEAIGQITLLDIPGPWGRRDAFGRVRKSQ